MAPFRLNTIYRYNITHFYCPAIDKGFYSDVVECLPEDISYDNGAHPMNAVLQLGHFMRALCHVPVI